MGGGEVSHTPLISPFLSSQVSSFVSFCFVAIAVDYCESGHQNLEIFRVQSWARFVRFFACLFVRLVVISLLVLIR